jgi:hypothetical protein
MHAAGGRDDGRDSRQPHMLTPAVRILPLEKAARRRRRSCRSEAAIGSDQG